MIYNRREKYSPTQLQVVETLLKAGADPNATNQDKVTPLYSASSSGNLQIVNRLLESNADPNISADNGTTPLYTASFNGYLPIVERLLNSKANITQIFFS